MAISVATVITAHYEFLGLGDTPAQAVDALMRAWARHVQLTGADPGYVTHDDVQVVTGEPGTGYRDRSPLTTPATTASVAAARAPRVRPRPHPTSP